MIEQWLCANWSVSQCSFMKWIRLTIPNRLFFCIYRETQNSIRTLRNHILSKCKAIVPHPINEWWSGKFITPIIWHEFTRKWKLPHHCVYFAENPLEGRCTYTHTHWHTQFEYQTLRLTLWNHFHSFVRHFALHII